MADECHFPWPLLCIIIIYIPTHTTLTTIDGLEMDSHPLGDSVLVVTIAESSCNALAEKECERMLSLKPWNLYHLWLYRLGCVWRGYDNSRYIGYGVFEAVRRCFLLAWLKFADVACLWYAGGSLLIIIRTGLRLPYAHGQNSGKSLFRYVVARLPCSVIVGTQFYRYSSWQSSLTLWSKIP